MSFERVEIGPCTLYRGRCEDVLPAIADDCPPLIVTDPPYGTGGWRRFAAGSGRDPAGSLVAESWDNGRTDWIGLTPNAVAIATFWPPAKTSRLLQASRRLGLTKHRCMYWRKPDPKPMPGGRSKWSVEPVWVLSRAGVVLYGGDDWFECSAVRLNRDHEALGHPYQKPLRVARWLLGKFRDFDAVTDPFMGVGTFAEASVRLGKRFVGIEQDSTYFDVACRRVEVAVKDQCDSLFPALPRQPHPELFAEVS